MTERASLYFSLSISLPFALLRMADYRSLHGLSGADMEAQLEREREREREDRTLSRLYPCALATLTIQSTHSLQAIYLYGKSEDYIGR